MEEFVWFQVNHEYQSQILQVFLRKKWRFYEFSTTKIWCFPLTPAYEFLLIFSFEWDVGKE